MEHIVLKKFEELPKKNMFAYTADSKDAAVAKHLKMGGKQPVTVYQWGGMYYMDTDGPRQGTEAVEDHGDAR